MFCVHNIVRQTPCTEYAEIVVAQSQAGKSAARVVDNMGRKEPRRETLS